MPPKPKNFSARFYAGVLTLITPLYRLIFQAINRAPRGDGPQRIALLVSRPQDVELLIDLHEKASRRKDVILCFWVVENCANRYPEVLSQLQEKQAAVEQVVSFARWWKTLQKLMRTDVFLSTVESTTAKHKLPYMITRLANAAGVSTYTLQHGFPNLGLNYCDHVYGTDIRFAAKKVLTWGPVEKLPSWVSRDTRRKCIAVGCPKKLVIFDNDSVKLTSKRPIIAIFENLHGHGYDREYISRFLSHLEETAKQRKEFHFILKSHPASLRCRTRELTDFFSRLKHVEIVDRVDGKAPALTTPWLLSHAAGVITNPSTIALDGALAGVPVAVARYGFDLPVYSPLTMLDNHEDWESFLDKLEEKSGALDLKRRTEDFLGRVLVPGDAATRILDLMTGQPAQHDPAEEIG